MKLVLQLMGLTLVLILVLSLVLGCSILLFVENRPVSPPFLLLGLVLGGIITAVSFLKIMAINRQWSADFVASFENDPESLLAQWEVPLEQWRALAAYEAEENRQAAPMMGGCMGVLFGGMVVLGCWATLGPAWALALGLVIGGAVGLVIWFFNQQSPAREDRQASALGHAEVALRPDGLLINRTKAVPWSGVHGTLETFSCERLEGLEFPVLTVAVRKTTGNDTITHVHRFPVPESELPKIEAIEGLIHGDLDGE